MWKNSPVKWLGLHLPLNRTMKKNITHTKAFTFTIALFAFLFCAIPFSYAQNHTLIVQQFDNAKIRIDNKIFITDKLLSFQNNILNITLSKDSKLLEIIVKPLGVRWSGSLADFNEQYANFQQITQADTSQNTDFSLLQNSNWTKTKKKRKIVGYNARQYSIKTKDHHKILIWYNAKLFHKDLKALSRLGQVLHKISIAIQQNYSLGLYYINPANINAFPMQISYSSNAINEYTIQEKVIAIETSTGHTKECKGKTNYKEMSLLDLLVGTKSELNNQ